MKFTKVQTPRGAKDILPPEGYKKSLIEQKAASFFEGWGYRRVYTPTFEFYDALAQGDGPEISEKLYRFVDRDGHTLALRPELTTPIARVAATRYSAEEMPLRLYYVGNVFRYDEPQTGRQREFTQAGVELIGAEGPCADAEVVTLAAQALHEIGLTSTRLDLGHIGYLHGLLEGVADEAWAASLKEALLARDYVRYEKLVRDGALEPARTEALLELPSLRGDRSVLQKARALAAGRKGALAALDDLEAVYDLVAAYGFRDVVALDLGMIKNLDYYTGLLLEGYTPELGFTLCTGGRYDTLIGRFGRSFPATGFAFGVERAMLALDRQGWSPKEPRPDVLLFVADAREHPLLFAAARAVRASGRSVQLGIGCTTWAEAGRAASAGGIGKVLRVVSEGNGAVRGGSPVGGLSDHRFSTEWTGPDGEFHRGGLAEALGQALS